MFLPQEHIFFPKNLAKALPLEIDSEQLRVVVTNIVMGHIMYHSFHIIESHRQVVGVILRVSD